MGKQGRHAKDEDSENIEKKSKPKIYIAVLAMGQSAARFEKKWDHFFTSNDLRVKIP